MRIRKNKKPRHIMQRLRLMRLVAMNFKDEELKESFVKVLPIRGGGSIVDKVLFRLCRLWYKGENIRNR